MNDPTREEFETLDEQERRGQVKVVLDAIEDIKHMNVTVNVEHVSSYLEGVHDVPAEIVEKVVHLSVNPVALILLS